MWHWSGGNGVLAGRSAAVVLGVRWVSDDAPAEIVTDKRPRSGDIVAYRDTLAPDEIVRRGAMRVTSPARTGYDLARRLPFLEAVIMVDALGQATGLQPGELLECASRHPGARGLRQLRRVAEVADPAAESPGETRIRVAIIEGGLPRPISQYVVEVEGGFVARADLAWPEWKVIVEYDGAHHFHDEAQMRRDVDRWNYLGALGWTVIRVTRHQLRDGGAVVLFQIRQALRAAGALV